MIETLIERPMTNLLDIVGKLFINNKFIILLIVFNTIVVFIQCYPNAPRWLGYVDSLLVLMFVLEVVFKVRHKSKRRDGNRRKIDWKYGFRRYWRDGWNRFDFVITVLSLPLLMQLFIPITEYSFINPAIALRIFRLLRLLNAFRIVRVFPQGKLLISGVERAIKVSYVIIAIFLLFLLVSALISCVFFSQQAPEYFGTPFRSIYSTFRMFTLDGWYEIPDAVGEKFDSNTIGWIKMYFTLLLFMGGIIGMSFVNSVIINAMVSNNNNELEKLVNSLNRKIDKMSSKIEELQNKEDNNKPKDIDKQNDDNN